MRPCIILYYFILAVLLCSIAENFYSLYGTTRKNTLSYYTTKMSNRIYLLTTFKIYVQIESRKIL